ncbi:DNA helicase/exodeoxyribonuclease V, alpha subunit [Arsukibacterium tuosuense]|uniref:RecBCD enzyme subunit RecD n=1 Tax=Arsukibacterium tuosuense TaxID=1323745 RepID=A0A285IUK6_9GAMM|nr:exodeoxyribonuclease V subunit alpha [Arsukibacterium tuosuense]SNY50621.1 DNA helicase/exodeoxyribonuclease V, alpha subunit [Arsukibacterium tuosuense]
MYAEQMLEQWQTQGWLRPLDLAFASFIARYEPAQPLVWLAAALCSYQLKQGHVCLDLVKLQADPVITLGLVAELAPILQQDLQQQLAAVSVAQWHSALSQSAVVDHGHGSNPLVLTGSRLYLRRYWQYEQDIAVQINQRLAQNDALTAQLPVNALLPLIRQLFQQSTQQQNQPQPDWQQLACALACRSAFTVITGGPGTGKTTTVVRLLALLQLLQLSQQQPLLEIRLAAPTGKAAARLKDSISGALSRLASLDIAGFSKVEQAIPSNVSTIHRLLGVRPGSKSLRFNRYQPLPLDILVLDEASMVDVEMMAALLQALPGSARVILLGDKDQLSSVEAGALLAELCKNASAGDYRPATVAWLAAQTGQQIPDELISNDGSLLSQHIVMLRHSHRFGQSSGIGQLAAMVNRGLLNSAIWQDYPAELLLLKETGTASAGFQQLVSNGGNITKGYGYQHYLSLLTDTPPQLEEQDNWAHQILSAYSCFQILAATRKGELGVEQLNLKIQDILAKAGLIAPEHQWYAGRPVMVTRNDYQLGLMNGDIGICLPKLVVQPDGSVVSTLRVAFAVADGIKWVIPARLNAVETVFAMTVHKSQGSEFRHTVLVVADHDNGMLNRELLYTAITRASVRFSLICAEPKQLARAVQRQTLRAGGLSLALAD